MCSTIIGGFAIIVSFSARSRRTAVLASKGLPFFTMSKQELRGRFGELRILNLPIVLHFLDSDCELKFLLSRTELELQAVRIFDSINREELSQSNCQPDFSLWAFEFRFLSDQQIRFRAEGEPFHRGRGWLGFEDVYFLAVHFVGAFVVQVGIKLFEIEVAVEVRIAFRFGQFLTFLATNSGLILRPC